ncbi:hypothetical protein CMI37_01695 [Candidatus Pacearchaeota archaeon]|nr:hypothetical protein [Candidatus Pacearchaeota archaeon]|tara:strand:+ start:1663 stop:2310 length:648 start_codon:yes stop_codon:yes gene_type:complete
MKYVDPPFDLGETLKGTNDAGALINTHWQGAIFEFPDVDKTPALRGGKARRSGNMLRAICVRNTSGGALTVSSLCCQFNVAVGDYTVTSQATANTEYRKIFGTCKAVTGAVNLWGGIGDPELGSTTVADDDLFWVIIGGVCLAKLAENEQVVPGDILISSASGYLEELNSGSAGVAAVEAVNVIARALQESDLVNFDGSQASAGEDALVLVCVNM